MRETRTSLCRLCTAYCPIIVTVEEGRAVAVAGNPEAPLYGGYICPKARALPEQHYGPSRLTRPLRRRADGGHDPIASGQALDEIAARLGAIVDHHGPRSVAVYVGMGSVPFIASYAIAAGWLRALGSPMFFTAGSIDKPGILIALAMHGMWQAGQPPVDTADAWLFVGINPVISKSPGFPGQNPGLYLKRLVDRGAKLIVIDPRRTETAKRAHIHLQPRPGEDPTLLAGLIHVILEEKLFDEAFVTANAQGLEALRAAVAPFTPAYVAARADVPEADLIEAARVFARAGHSGVSCGTGPSFATHSTLTEYLALCLTTLCGRWARAGERLTKPNVLLPGFEARAQPWPAFQGWGFEPRLRVRGLGGCVSGLSAAALADEILLPGEGKIRALVVCGGNPMMAWPDQMKAHAALNDLDLLVTIDTEMTATAELSDYVIAPKLTLETPMTTYMPESVKYYGTTRGFDQPYAAYTPAIVDPPAGHDVIEDWEFFWGLAERLGFPIPVTTYFGNGPQAEHAPVTFTLDPKGPKPTTDQLIAMAHRSSRVPLEQVKQNPNGQIFESDQRVAPRAPGNDDRLELAAAPMIDELAAVLAEDNRAIEADYPFRLLPRRLNNILNSFGRRYAQLARKPYNPAFMNPEDMAALGLAEGDAIRITSPHGEIVGIAEGEAALRPGTVSMAHGFGRNPGEEDPRGSGANTGRLMSAEVDYDPITGIPRMGALPVRIAPFMVQG
ncbi:molybdopterin-dependent oxidoreductase [Sphingomonas histidinilytica]|uniref:molybdopterin-containing oxidoreductase family protein n=1 Tax=Rhizorhabdus histidinilytica TaxID=439228 RepID=UPI001ADB3D02|nr:molybdopterin-dependent oxidoreductase [Rhizorhabdus histidinilytica]MBO9376241.1 molybdopterin-dependent oxidoreductase [Rhizorhabdus histidinilytica]